MSARLRQLRREADALLAARGRQVAGDAARAAAEASAASLWGYLTHVVIDRVPEPCRYLDAAEPWQLALIRPLIPAVESVAGLRPDYRGPRSFWRTLPRGHDKTSSIGRLCNWLLAYSRRPVTLVAAAKDGDQAELLASAMGREAELNPWLKERVDYGRLRVKGLTNGSLLKILKADAAGAYGERADFILVDELTHWPRRDLWDALTSGRSKRSSRSGGAGPAFVVITNAGCLGTWPHELLQQAKADPAGWDVYDEEGYRCGWTDPDEVARDRAMLPPVQAKRLFDNCWIDPAAEAGYLVRSEIDACTDVSLTPKEKGEPGVEYIASIDYGARKDRTALCVMHPTREGVVIDRLDVWESKGPGEPVPVQLVEDWLTRVLEDFHRPLLVIDPWQMESVCQKFEQLCCVERFDYMGGRNNHRMAENLRTLIVSKRLRWYPNCGWLRHRRLPGDLGPAKSSTLADELVGLVIKEMSYGYRFDHTASGFSDRCVSVAMGALFAAQMCEQRDIAPTLVRTPLMDGWSGRESMRGFLPAPPSNPGPVPPPPPPPRSGEPERKPAPSIVRTWGSADNPLKGLFGL